MNRGDLLRVVEGEFKGTTLRVARVYPTLVELERQDKEGRYVSFVSEPPEVVERLTRPWLHCPVDFGHHLGDCCLVCGCDERKLGAHLPNNPDLTEVDKARLKKKDEIFEANWKCFNR